jgi:hypothetical protein
MESFHQQPLKVLRAASRPIPLRSDSLPLRLIRALSAIGKELILTLLCCEKQLLIFGLISQASQQGISLERGVSAIATIYGAFQKTCRKFVFSASSYESRIQISILGVGLPQGT